MPADSADFPLAPTDEIAQASQAMSDGEMRLQVKERKGYSQASGTNQIWFPFEMAVPLAQELVWEAGGDEVKWVLHSTPAAGNVVLGTLEMNCNALVFCEDSDHQRQFTKTLTEKAAERLASGQSRVFGNPFLRAKLHREADKHEKKDENQDEKDDKKSSKPRSSEGPDCFSWGCRHMRCTYSAGCNYCEKASVASP